MSVNEVYPICIKYNSMSLSVHMQLSLEILQSINMTIVILPSTSVCVKK